MTELTALLSCYFLRSSCDLLIASTTRSYLSFAEISVSIRWSSSILILLCSSSSNLILLSSYIICALISSSLIFAILCYSINFIYLYFWINNAFFYYYLLISYLFNLRSVINFSYSLLIWSLISLFYRIKSSSIFCYYISDALNSYTSFW